MTLTADDELRKLSRTALETKVLSLHALTVTQAARIEHLESELRIQRNLHHREVERQQELHDFELEQVKQNYARKASRAVLRHPAEELLRQRLAAAASAPGGNGDGDGDVRAAAAEESVGGVAANVASRAAEQSANERVAQITGHRTVEPVGRARRRPDVATAALGAPANAESPQRLAQLQQLDAFLAAE